MLIIELLSFVVCNSSFYSNQPMALCSWHGNAGWLQADCLVFCIVFLPRYDPEFFSGQLPCDQGK